MMGKQICDKSSLFLYSLLVVIVLFFIFIPANASPSFDRQEIRDNTDWFSMINYDSTISTPNGEKFTMNKTQDSNDCKTFNGKFPFPRITSVSYLSDGNKLNATVWLSSDFKSPVVNGSLDSIDSMKKLPWHNVGYTMSIDVKSIYKIGTDYFVHVSWDPISQKWKRDITEGSTTVGEGRIIQQENDVRDFYQEGKNYVTFSLDLKKIGNPDKYNILWTSYDVFINHDKLCYLLDVSNWAQAPPPEFIVSTTPNPILVRQGDKTTVEIEVKSLTNSKSNVVMDTPSASDLDMRLVNNQAAIPPLGIGTLLLEVNAPRDAVSHSYTIPLHSTYTFPTEGTIAGIQSFGNVNANITDTSYFVVTVQPALTPDQNFGAFWSTYGGIIGVISGAILSIFGKIGYDKLKLKRRDSTKTTNS